MRIDGINVCVKTHPYPSSFHHFSTILAIFSLLEEYNKPYNL